jgi:hypothetical protein
MKRIIALQHSSSTGKTSTLRELGNLLLLLPEESLKIIESPVGKNEKLSENEDFTLVIKLLHFDKTIGIESRGDPNCGLKDKLLKIIDNHNVDYLFCAMRTKGGTVSDVYDVSVTKNYEVLLTSPYYSNNDSSSIDFFNKLKAKHLFDLLSKLITERD